MAKKLPTRNGESRVDVSRRQRSVEDPVSPLDGSTVATFGPVLRKLFSGAQWQIVQSLVGGLSGSPVYVVDATGPITGSDSPLNGQYVLKLDTERPWKEHAECDRHRAVQERATDFAHDRIPALVVTAAEGQRSATLYEIAGHSLTDMRTAYGANLQHFRVICRTVSMELLTRLNPEYTLRHKRSVPELLEDWLGYRLRPNEAPRLHKFVDSNFGDQNIIAVTDRVLANPLWLARAPSLREDKSGVNFVGWIHGDLHPGNILIHRSSRRRTDMYWLIDFALASEAPLFFDQAYLEVALLLRHFETQLPRPLLQLLAALDDVGQPDLDIKPEDAGVYACITELRRALTEWRDTREPRRLDPVSAQIQLARVAAGLNWANKPLGRESDRALAFSYAAWAATNYAQIHREGLWLELLEHSATRPPIARTTPSSDGSDGSAVIVQDASRRASVSQPPMSIARRGSDERTPSGSRGRVQFGLLGEVIARRDDRELALAGPRQRALLAMLLLHANCTVSRELLVKELWSGQQVNESFSALNAAVSRLRRALVDRQPEGDEYSDQPDRADRIITREHGYLIRVEEGELDSIEFERDLAAGRAAIGRGEPSAALTHFGDALGRWRGDAFGEFRDQGWAKMDALRLEGLRVDALEERIGAQLSLGENSSVVTQLEGLVVEHPERERLYAHLMLALYRCSRRVEALEVFRRARSRLIDDYGVEPSSDLCELHQAILAQDPSLAYDRESGAAVVAQAPSSKPQREPQSLTSRLHVQSSVAFVGRKHESAVLDEALPRRGIPLRTVLVSGEPGIGKTRLVSEFAARALNGASRSLEDVVTQGSACLTNRSWRCSTISYVGRRVMSSSSS